MAEDVKRRAYRSEVRAEQARRTRERVLAAARELFVEHGYAATSIGAVARSAGVSPETVYAAFGSKRLLLESAAARGIETDPDAPEDLLERDWVRAVLELPGVELRLRAWTRHTAEAVERTAPLHAVIRAAASSDPELAGLYARLQEYRFSSQRRILEAVSAGVSRLDLEASAATFSALTSPELHQLLRRTRGWSEARYQRWQEATVIAAVLTPPTARG